MIPIPQYEILIGKIAAVKKVKKLTYADTAISPLEGRICRFTYTVHDGRLQRRSSWIRSREGTELIAIRELPTNKQREYEAVRKAIEITEQYPNGKQRLAVIRLVLWDRQYTLEGAAMKIPCSESHAKEWHGDFIRLVASNYGMLD